MKKVAAAIWQHFVNLPFLLKIIWIFCVLGLFLNTWMIGMDIKGHAVLLQLHLGFWVLYAGQVIFILMHERIIFILSLLQVVLAFLTNLDFTFVPPLRLVGEAIYIVFGPFSMEGMETYKYIFVSLSFTLEMLKTFLIWWLLRPQKNLSTTPVV